MNLTAVTDSIARGQIFGPVDNLRTAHVYVVSPMPVGLSGPLAERVETSQREYTAQYLTDGGRRVHRGHVAYYVTTAAGYVLGYVEHSGKPIMAPSTEVTPRRMEAIRAGLAAHGPSYTARKYGMHEPGYTDGEGMTFTLWARDPRHDVRLTRPVATFTDRDEANAARQEADRFTRYARPEDRQHAWVTRDAEPVPDGITWGEYEARRRVAEAGE